MKRNIRSAVRFLATRIPQVQRLLVQRDGLQVSTQDLLSKLHKFDDLQQLVAFRVAERLGRYYRDAVVMDLSPADDMFQGDMDHYLGVGRSAIEIIAAMMIVTGKDEVDRVLDLPCGGGRVTRHLKLFFPEAQLFVGDLDDRKRTFVSRTFGAKIVDPLRDFALPSPYRYDLVFVGSLLTHLSADLCRASMKWFIEALRPDGLLIVTFHGRHSLCHPLVTESDEWRPYREKCLREGFTFRAHDPQAQNDPLAYGSTLSTPSWVMRLVERDPDVRVIGYQEAVWDNNHDVLTLQKRPITP